MGARTDNLILTGCSVKGSRDACRICQFWQGNAGMELVRQHLGKAALKELENCELGHLPALAFTAGVHPHDAKTCNDDTLQELRTLAGHEHCVALGECGLDYDRMFSPHDVQLEWCKKQVSLAVELKMPLFLHERDRDPKKGSPLGSSRELIEILE